MRILDVFGQSTPGSASISFLQRIDDSLVTLHNSGQIGHPVRNQVKDTQIQKVICSIANSMLYLAFRQLDKSNTPPDHGGRASSSVATANWFPGRDEGGGRHKTVIGGRKSGYRNYESAPGDRRSLWA